MKRLIFPSIVVCVVMLFAGTGFAADIGFGVKGGIALAGYSGDDSDDFASKLGFHAGGFATMQLMDMLSLQPEVLFSAIGAKGDLSGFDGKYKENLSYIEIPVLVKFYPPISLPVALNIFAGPSLGINLSGKYTASGDYETLIGDDKGDLEDDFAYDLKTLVFGLSLGAGVDIDKIVIDARYTMGLTSYEEDLDLKNSVFSVMAGYRFK